MSTKTKIITVSFSPAWDITCRGRNLDWGSHEYIDQQTIRPAGKALNVSKALAWMGQRSTATGLWAAQDYRQMQKAVHSAWPLIGVKMTAAAGHTRQNVTVVDTANDRDMHLRNKSTLATRSSLRRLKADLQPRLDKNSLCVFAGAMPDGELLGDVVGLVKGCEHGGAKILVDTSGPALRELVATGCVWLIKPNVNELRELLGEQIADNPAGLAGAARELLDKVEIVLVSRGKKGALLVTAHGAWRGQCRGRRRIASTVGCGDYLLAGFLRALKEGTRPDLALATGLKAATARAWGWHEATSWSAARRRTKVELSRVS